MVEVVLTAEPEAVPRARRFAAATIGEVVPDLLDDALLVVSELVTNALLHGGSPVTLRLELNAGVMRIEVSDPVTDLPVRMQDGDQGMTGRGLRVVDALAAAWGVDLEPTGGKTVWAELSSNSTERPRSPGSKRAPSTRPAAPSAPAAQMAATDRLYAVELGDVPTDLLIAAKAHIDNLVREFTLAAAADAGRHDDGMERLPADLAELVRTVVHGFAPARAQIKRQALAAAAEGARMTRLTLRLPASAAAAGEEYLAALDEADRYARSAKLLTLETPPAHRVFRRWYVQELVDELRRQAGGAPARRVTTFPEKLAEEIGKLAPLEELASRLSALQTITAAVAGARTVSEVARAVATNAVESLGAQAARIYMLSDDRMLRSLATAGGEPVVAARFTDFSLDAELPGSVAIRTGKPVVVRNLAELGARFPPLAGAYREERKVLVAPLVAGGAALGVLALTFPAASRVDDHTQLAFLTTLADVTAQALERAAATVAAAQASEKLAFLAEASIALSSSLDYRSVLDAVARLVVPRLADWCVVQLLDDGALKTVALAHTDPAKVAWANRLSGRFTTDPDAPTGSPRVARTGRSELYAEIDDAALSAAATEPERLTALREMGLESALIVPLAGRTGTIGTLTMIYAQSERRYSEADVAFAEDLARRAALAVETAHAFHEQTGRLERVVRVAEAAQHAILAPPPSKIGAVALAARYVSAAAEALIGGDLYEVVSRPGAVRLLIGDVRGKGLGAIRLATVVLGEFRAAAADVDDLREVAVQIDRRLGRYLGEEDFVTALIAEIDDDGVYTIANCGHPNPLLAGGGGVMQLDVEPALPLGLGAAPFLARGQLAPGERLLLYTDGIIEARDPNRHFVDLLDLAASLPEGDMDVVLDRVLDRLRSAVGAELGDDLALLVAEYQGPAPA